MIKSEVIDGHVSRFPDELPILRRLEADFEITWANRISAFNTEFSCYFAKPLAHISQSFGFEQELVFAISDFQVPQARLIQAIEQTFERLPAKGRVDQTVAVIISRADDLEKWLRSYIASNPQGRAYIGISHRDLISNTEDWFVRNIFVNQLFSRDLFEYTLPLNEDLFFFGRQNIVAEHVDAVRKSENRGLFGLRKTGKTSVLFKIRRQCRIAGIPCIYYDCKLPSLYKLTADELIDIICEDIEENLDTKIKGWRSKKFSSDRFISLVKNIPDNMRFCLIFDEVEYISAGSTTAEHWKGDYVAFWQTIWSSQSQYRIFSFIISGVNASLVEVDKIGKTQNPLFGIVKPRYLTGFDKPELISLLNVLGKRMGLRFSEAASNALFERYGGHPLLTRLICSQINTEMKVAGTQRPIIVRELHTKKDAVNREQEIQFYCGHITSELEDFYPNEYELLELLASGNKKDFNELIDDIDVARHLKSYGLVDFSVPHMPKFAIPVIQGYIASKWKTRHGHKSSRYIVPESRRPEYIVGRVSSIIRDLRLCERRFAQLNMPQLYGGSGPAEAEILALTRPVATSVEAASFLNQCNRSLIEPLDSMGKKLKRDKYFFEDLRAAYPKLWPALDRIRSYRNFLMHLSLTPLAQEKFNSLIQEDFDGDQIDNVIDGWFQLQSIILDSLIIGIQAELASYD